jgi:hypothetical protein
LVEARAVIYDDLGYRDLALADRTSERWQALIVPQIRVGSVLKKAHRSVRLAAFGSPEKARASVVLNVVVV